MLTNADALRLVLITDGSAALGPPATARLLAVIAAALRGGATAVMLREKGLPAGRLASLATEALALTRAAGAWLIVNHAVDVALDVGADAVHLGWRSEPLESVLARAGGRLRVGVSTHSPEEAAAAARRGVDYVTFGPVFPTPSKEGLVAVQGLEGVRAARVAAGSPSPIAIVGLGGIDEARAGSVVAAGADGVAVIRAVMDAADPETAARRLLARLSPAGAS